jgi:uncharacterized damage-inducible protein DinB
MSIQTFKKVFAEDLVRLRKEIEAYRHEEKLWYKEGAIANPAGNLCLHLVGNLNTYIGATLGNSGYVRDRPAEFSSTNISKAELLKKIDDTMAVVDRSLDVVREEQLGDEYPSLVLDEKTTIDYMLTHLVAHLGYHLGQINYHRRLLDHH